MAALHYLHDLPRTKMSSISYNVGCQPHWLTGGPVNLMRVNLLPKDTLFDLAAAR